MANKVFADFFTSFAVAWATAGIVSPFFTPTDNPMVLFLAGAIGSSISLRFAIMFTEGYQK